MHPIAKAVTVATGVLFIVSSFPANAAHVRFYELHKNDGQKRIRVKNNDQPGCHNFGGWGSGKKELHRMAQVGFSWCSVYSEPDCPANKVLEARWQGKDYRIADIDVSQPQTRLLRGSKWQFAEKNVDAASWYCEQ